MVAQTVINICNDVTLTPRERLTKIKLLCKECLQLESDKYVAITDPQRAKVIRRILKMNPTYTIKDISKKVGGSPQWLQKILDENPE
jgi:hypothetical protein